jgi:5S rRNA maturation endonuclease (ribonuclease M5)
MTAQEYLNEHEINENTVKEFNLSWDENYLYIPVKDSEGNDLFIKSRYLHFGENSKESKYKNSQGSHATLFNYHSVKDSSIVVLCEGELDTMKLTQGEIPAVSSTGGAGTFLSEFVDLLKDKKVYICYDTDNAGQKGIRNVLEYLPAARIIILPEGKDICEYFHTNKSYDDFIKLMRNAISAIEWTALNIPEEYKLIDGETLSQMEIEEIPYLIESILPAEGFCFIYGAEGVGKSLVALSMALSVAKGEDWLNVFKVPNKANVLYIDKENTQSTIIKRLKAMGTAPKNIYWLKTPEIFQLNTEKGNLSEFAQALTTLVTEKRITLIVVDSLVDLMVGNESSSQDTQIFFSALRQLFPNIAIIVLHHENKPATGTYRTAAQRVRGSTNINAQATIMFRIEHIAKSKTEITMQQTKNRDSQRMDKFMLRMDMSIENTGKSIVTGFTYMGIVAGNDTTKESEEFEEILMNALEESKGRLGRKEILDLCRSMGISESTMDRVISTLETKKQIKKTKSGRNVIIILNGFNAPLIPQEGGFL